MTRCTTSIDEAFTAVEHRAHGTDHALMAP